MNEQTEKLRGVIEGYLNSPVNTFKPTHILLRQILQACKEVLIFRDGKELELD